MRALIVNADDFGFSAGINRGIAEAHERGIVTSASLMVDQPAAEQAASYASGRAELSLGLHLELRARRLREHAVAADVERQLARFRSLVGREPTHLDSHRHRHRQEPARAVVAALGDRLAVPVRDVDTLVRHCGDFYGQTYGWHSTRRNHAAITAAALVAIVERLPDGLTELCTHPGYPDDLAPPFRKEPYREERALEVAALCDERVRAAVERLGIRLCSFHDIAALRGPEHAPQP